MVLDRVAAAVPVPDAEDVFPVDWLDGGADGCVVGVGVVLPAADVPEPLFSMLVSPLAPLFPVFPVFPVVPLVTAVPVPSFVAACVAVATLKNVAPVPMTAARAIAAALNR